ncbi:FAD-dependent 5-carboxymethylaminomethyl-2-thiouridine(34) oxidoreductase MnmC [Parvularcula oceani]|uniref:FAD-dependent 5-carboxymethylaminomethyl-2-thiouridine(34) oxidoreductase MnmC n=1 Tax=Parvularcula oceani TaxID=1247963 RepID=UPI00068F2B04|nr:FAD-dependent 5-carboxymethylaminomethyl-2-thiouridine(34) oxidoreductase MnmC [Parvularcula oceani]
MSGKLPDPDLRRDGPVLRSGRFSDVYYSQEDGLAESRHVFLDGNELENRFAALEAGEVFAIGELGFGTGLNIAAAISAFSRRGHDRGHLHIWSAEGFPLPPDAFVRAAREAASRWSDAAQALDALAAHYPEPRPGQATVRLGRDVTLTLAFGEVEEVLMQARLRADAWFLDGFSPATNPQMWSETVLRLVAARSRRGATAATFTVAGAVRRGLQAAGFDIRKTPGFGRKREMLRAELAGTPPSIPSVPGHLRDDEVAPSRADAPVAILGAGIAGASLAWHLRRLGRQVIVFDPQGQAAGASGNPAGLVSPRLDLGDTPVARLYRDAFLYASAFYEDAAPDALAARGATVLMAEERARRLVEGGLWPSRALRVEAEGLFVGASAVLRPAVAVDALLGDVPVRTEVPQIAAAGAGPALRTRQGSLSCSAIVVAAGPAMASLLDLGAPALTASRGQIDLFANPVPERILSGEGYAAPAPETGTVVGATYDDVPADATPIADEASTAANAARARQLLGEEPSGWIAARAALRAVTPDRHPLMGPVPDVEAYRQRYAGLSQGRRVDAAPPYRPALFVLGGLGSRGLSTAPLLSAALASLICGTPSPMEVAGAAAISPARFLARGIKRRIQSPS